jgi:glycosyltransferase involved in cell wall biosynthesis
MTYTSVGAGNVSIVIPCYNQGATLLEALASVEPVRNENVIDVIIVDDGSSETETSKILDELAKTGHCVVSQPHRGLGAARNAGIRLAKGEFILPLDSDDRLRDVYLNEGVSLLRRNPSVGVIYSDAEYFGERTGRSEIPEFDLLSLIRENFIDACALFRKKLWEEVGGYDERMPWMGWEDWDFWLRAAYYNASFVHLPKVGFDYRVRNDSVRVKVHEHASDLVHYMFGKPELACYKLVREMDAQAHILRTGIRSMEDLVQGVQRSRSYRLGHSLLAPARLLRKLWGGFR